MLRPSFEFVAKIDLKCFKIFIVGECDEIIFCFYFFQLIQREKNIFGWNFMQSVTLHMEYENEQTIIFITIDKIEQY